MTLRKLEMDYKAGGSERIIVQSEVMSDFHIEYCCFAPVSY